MRSSHAGEANRRGPAEVVRQNNFLGVKVSELSGRPIEEPIISGLIDAPRSRDCDVQGHRGWRGWPIIAWRPLRRPAPQLQVPLVARPRNHHQLHFEVAGFGRPCCVLRASEVRLDTRRSASRFTSARRVAIVASRRTPLSIQEARSASGVGLSPPTAANGRALPGRPRQA